MDTELLYTIGVGNFRSYLSIYIMQVVIFLLSTDMNEPLKGVLMAFFLASLISMVSIGIIFYYNGEIATSGGAMRYIRSIDDKLRLFRKVLMISYACTLVLLILMFIAGSGVAEYFIFTGPASLVVVFIVMTVHDYLTNMRYKQLKKADWVFDYNREPSVRTVSTGMNVGIGMFDEQNHFIISESPKAMELDEVFGELPPGTKLNGHRLKKPEYREIRFNGEFEYRSMNVFKSINLKRESKHDVKMFNLYMRELEKYSSLYLIEDGFVKCQKTTIAINKNKIEKYIEENDYIRRFVASKEAEVAYISMMLKPEFSKQSMKRFMNKHTKVIESYLLRQTGLGLFLEDNDHPKLPEQDISYLQQYMSLNLEEYMCKPKTVEVEDNYTSLQDRIDNFPRKKKKKEDEFGKTLHRLDVGGEKVYFFAEDLKTLGELDEIIFSKFINRDLRAIKEKHDIDE